MLSWLISLGAAVLAIVAVFLAFIGFCELTEYLETARVTNHKLDNVLRTVGALTGPAIGVLLFLAVLTWVMHGCLYE